MISLKRLAAGLVLALVSAGSACNAQSDEWVVIAPAPEGTGQPVRITGVVRRMEIEGGLFVIRAENGMNFNPTNLPAAFREDGLAVEAEGRRRDDMVSIGQVGPIVDLERIRRRSGAAAGPPPPPSAVQDYHAIGTEPFWGLDIDGSGLRFTTPDNPVGIRFPPLTGDRVGDTVLWRGQTESASIEARLWAESCSDGMSDRSWSLTALVKVDTTNYRGCAEPR